MIPEIIHTINPFILMSYHSITQIHIIQWTTQEWYYDRGTWQFCSLSMALESSAASALGTFSGVVSYTQAKIFRSWGVSRFGAAPITSCFISSTSTLLESQWMRDYWLWQKNQFVKRSTCTGYELRGSDWVTPCTFSISLILKANLIF